MALIQDKAVFVTANGINKTLRQAIIDGNIGAGGGGASSTQLFNVEIPINAVASSIMGLLHCRVPFARLVSTLVVTLYNKGSVSSGTLTVDIKKNTTPDDIGMTSIFSSPPSFDFATDPDYSEKTGTLETSALSAGDWLRIDVTSIPTGWVGTFHVSMYS